MASPPARSFATMRTALHALVVLAGLGAPSWAQTIFVDDDATGAANGASWTDAFRFLQDALGAAQAGDEIWVAGGVYRPDQGAGQLAGSRAAAFFVPSDVRLYGGFAGTESTLAQRAGLFESTVLSGDLAGDDATVGNAENAFHVMVTSNTSPATLVDGFTISGGNASQLGVDSRGAGIYSDNGRLTLRNCIIEDNECLDDGAGMSSTGSGSDLLIVACTFRDNLAHDVGGGLFASGATLGPRVVACRFLGNASDRLGGGVYLFGPSTETAQFVGCLFSGNFALERGGALYASSSTNATFSNCTVSANRTQTSTGAGLWASDSLSLFNCILWGNVDANGSVEGSQISSSAPQVDNCCIQGLTAGLGGFGNLGGDPLFADFDGADDIAGTDDDDVALLPGSPCVDAGDNARVPSDFADVDADGDVNEPLPLDLAGAARFFDDAGAPDVGSGTVPLVDMGAFEKQPTAISGDVAAISLSAGGTQTLQLDGGVGRAGQFYLLLGSLTGTSPGFPIDAFLLPLNVDSYTLYTLTSPNTPPLAGSFGVLDGVGRATATFTLPPASNPALAGLTVNHAWVALELLPNLLHPTLVSEALPLDLLP